MNKALRIGLLLSLLLMLAGCFGSNREKLIGTWTADGVTIEFREDGSWVSMVEGETFQLWGTWTMDEEGKSITFNGGGPPYPQQTIDEPFEFKDGKLLLRSKGKVIGFSPVGGE